MVFVPSSMTAIRGSLKPSPADIIPPGTNKQERSSRENGTIIQDNVAWTTFRFPTNTQRKLIDNDELFPELIFVTALYLLQL